jgi:hypothetical protein
VRPKAGDPDIATHQRMSNRLIRASLQSSYIAAFFSISKTYAASGIYSPRDIGSTAFGAIEMLQVTPG